MLAVDEIGCVDGYSWTHVCNTSISTYPFASALRIRSHPDDNALKAKREGVGLNSVESKREATATGKSVWTQMQADGQTARQPDSQTGGGRGPGAAA